MASCLINFIQRIFPLLTSLWMQADMYLDVRQTLIYYDHAFNENGTYRTWALEYNKTNNGTLETVHQGYFYTAMVVWILPPFLMSAFVFLGRIFFKNEFNPFFNTNLLIGEFFSFEINPPFNSKILNILFFIVYFPIDFLVFVIVIYVLTPFCALKVGVIMLVRGKIDKDYMVTKGTAARSVPVFKLFENLGEAIPQAILCLVFISNNFAFVMHDETSFFPIPTSCVSILFSFGSIIMGIYSGLKAC